MKLLLTIFSALAIICVFDACDTNLRPPVFEINKRIVYNADRDFVLYATNETDFFSPNILHAPFGQNSIKRALKISAGANYYVRDASCDCRYALLLAEDINQNKYDICLYDLNTDSSYNITEGIRSSFNDPLFFNPDTVLFLKDGVLHAYSINNKDWEYFPIEDKFLYLFKGDNHIVFLQDSGSSIWMFDVSKKKYSKLWKAPDRFMSSRKIKMHNDTVFFMSDHENGFNSIYKITIETHEIKQVISGNYDYFLVNNSLFVGDTLCYIKNDGLHFVSNITKLPKTGVIYDHVSKNDRVLMLYANLEKPASLYLLTDTGLVNLLNQFDQPLDYDVLTEYNESGVDNLVFLPKTTVKQWVVWLHGGPHEQVSRRFNRYLYHLVSNRIGVIVLNYPGSTGMGNDAELRHIPHEKRLAKQLEAINADLKKISQKYDVGSFSLIGVSYGSLLAHRLATSKYYNVNKLIDFSGVNTSTGILTASTETLYIMGDRDFMLSNKQRTNLLYDHEKIGAKVLVLERDGHSISRNRNIFLACKKMIDFLNM